MKKILYLLAFFYLILIFLIILNPFNYYNYDSYILFDYLIFIVVILILSKFSFKSNILNEIIFKKYIYSLNKILFILSISVAFFVLLMLYRLDLSLQNIRDIFFFGSLTSEKSIFEYITIPQIFINAFLFYFLIVNSFNFFRNKKSIFHFKHFIYSALSLTLLDFSTGGRLVTFYVLNVITIQFLIFSKISIRKINKKIFNSFLVLFIFLITVSIYRSNALIEFSYKYLVGPSFLYSYSLNDPISLLNSSEYDQFGYSFMTFNWIIVGTLKLFSYPLETLFSISDGFRTIGYQIDNNSTINAFFTGHMYFYKDFKLLSNFFILMFTSSIIYFFRKNSIHIIVCFYILFFLVQMFRENMFNNNFFVLSFIICVLGIGVKRVIK